MEQQEQLDKDRRIAELEQQVFQLSCRVTALEAVQPHMATKAEMIASRGIFNLHFGRRKSKDEHAAPFVGLDFSSFLIAIAPALLSLVVGLIAIIAVLLLR